MRILSCLALIPLFYSGNVFAEEGATKIVSEPPYAAVTIITNEWTTHFDQEIEDYKRRGISAETIAKAQLKFDEIKRENPSETINCITPCIVNIPFKFWNSSDITVTKEGFPDYATRSLSHLAKRSAKSAPEQINIIFKMPKSVPESCVFYADYVVEGSHKEQACYRPRGVGPKTIRRNKLSYKCVVEFDLDRTGRTENIKIANCPEKKLEKLTLKNVKNWRYVPKIEAGETVAVKGIQTKILYSYYDKYGDAYPFAE